MNGFADKIDDVVNSLISLTKKGIIKWEIVNKWLGDDVRTETDDSFMDIVANCDNLDIKQYDDDFVTYCLNDIGNGNVDRYSYKAYVQNIFVRHITIVLIALDYEQYILMVRKDKDKYMLVDSIDDDKLSELIETMKWSVNPISNDIDHVLEQIFALDNMNIIKPADISKKCLINKEDN